MATILERLKKIIAEQLGVDEDTVTSSASFAEDFNAGSTDLAELIAVIETAFSTPKQKVVIPDKTIEEIFTVQDIVDLLHEYVPED
jgi:acyl carrier protein